MLDSLISQMLPDDDIEVIVCDFHRPDATKTLYRRIPVALVAPKPCAWSGKHRITNSDWWSKASHINTAPCYVTKPWVLMLDDRSVLAPGFMSAVREAIAGDYVMAGTYQKRIGMDVAGGVITNSGTITGEDTRMAHVKEIKAPNPFPCGGEWLYGCALLVPLGLILQTNGSPETLCCGLGFEDVAWGLILQNAGAKMMFDSRAMLIEDRSPDWIGEPMKRSSKEKHKNDTSDKAHTVLKIIRTAKRSENPFGDLRELRDKIQSGHPFPVINLPQTDWFDGSKIEDLP